jgi:hypothetical protein
MPFPHHITDLPHHIADIAECIPVGSSIKNYEKIILKFVVLSIALARLGTILPVIREITHIKKK